MINIQHASLSDTVDLAKLDMSIGTNIGFAQRRNNLMGCNSPCLQQRKSHLLHLSSSSDATDTY